MQSVQNIKDKTDERFIVHYFFIITLHKNR